MAVEATGSGACVEGGVGGTFAPIVSAPLLGGDGLGKAATIQSIYGEVHEQAQELSHTGAAAGTQKKRKHKKKGDFSNKGVLIGVCLAVVGFLGLFLSQVFRSNASSRTPSSPSLPPPIPYRHTAAPSPFKPVTHEPLPDFSKMINTVETIALPLPSQDPVQETDLSKFHTPLPYFPLPHLAPDISQFELIRTVANRSDLDASRVHVPEKHFEATSLLRMLDVGVREAPLPSIYGLPVIAPDALLLSRKEESLECPKIKDLSDQTRKTRPTAEDVDRVAAKVNLVKETVQKALVKTREGLVMFYPKPATYIIPSFKELLDITSLESFRTRDTYERTVIGINACGGNKTDEGTTRIAGLLAAAEKVYDEVIKRLAKPKDSCSWGPARGRIVNFPESEVIVLLGTEDTTDHILYVNGIQNTAADATATTLKIYTQNPQATHYTIYNPTRGIVLDIVNSIGMDGRKTSKVAEHIVAVCRKIMKDPRNKLPVITCHSQGADHVRAALEQMTVEERQKVIVRAFGPATIISDSLCPNAINYVSANDFVPFLKNPSLFVVAGERSLKESPFQWYQEFVLSIVDIPKNVVILDPEPGASKYCDHEIDQTTYQKALKSALKELINPYAKNY